MLNSRDSYELIFSYEDTKQFLNQVREAADAHRSSLGFLPASVYQEFARKELLYVLVERQDSGVHYRGHLLFELRFPRAHVVQMFTIPECRRSGLASRLIDHFVRALTQFGFTSIYARVAEDLTDANAFWERLRFQVQSVRQGGVSRNRKILVRCRELPSPQLFPTSGINADNPLGLMTALSVTAPIFLLDLNVLFDVAGPRRSRHPDAIHLFHLERMDFCRLAISSEIREELRRTATTGRTDPMDGFIDIFPSFPLYPPSQTDPLLQSLASLVFPLKPSLSANDRSDLRHIATAIQHNLDGLITNDAAVLEAAHQIKKGYGIEVMSPAAFQLDSTVFRQENQYQALSGGILRLLEAGRDSDLAVHALLSKLQLSPATIVSGWLPSTGSVMRFGVWDNDCLVAYATWTNGPSATVAVRMAVDESAAHANSAIQILLVFLLEQLPHQGPRQVTLELPKQHSQTRDLARGFGFRDATDRSCLTKVVLGCVLAKTSWTRSQSELMTKSGIGLPDDIPTYRGFNQQIPLRTPDGNRTHVSLDTLESLLSPALLCLPGRPAVITPVQRSFSEPLLGHSPQGSLLPLGQSSLFQDRTYLSAPKTLRHFKKGALILFYESSKRKGRCSIVAIARVVHAYLRACNDLGDADLGHSVLTKASVDSIGKSKTKTVTVFDNIFPLPRPVSLAFLRSVGCGDANDLISTNSISDTQLQEILIEAFRA